MGSSLSPKFYDLLQKHLDTGVPVVNMAFSEEQKERALICLDVHRRLEENDMMDVDKYLRNKYHRTSTQIRQDKNVVNYLLAELNGESKELSRYRIRRVAEKTIRMGEASGDWKPMIEGAKMLHKIEGLDKPETAEDIEQNTYNLPPVFTTDFTKVDPDAQRYSEADIERLRKKYRVQKDKTQEMVEAKLGLFIPAGSTLEEEEEENHLSPSFDLNDLTDPTDLNNPTDLKAFSAPLAFSINDDDEE